MSITVDGDFSYAREIYGSGTRVFSQYWQGDFILTRLYVQSKNTYAPLPISTKDGQYTTAYLIEESEIQRDGYLVWFRRIYATIPATRTESRSVAFTFPGSSGLVIAGNGGVVRWSKYGFSAPYPALRAATVTISYSLGQPFVQNPTQILYNGQPVDFAGQVWTDDGKKLLGETSPNSVPITFIISDTARLWKGNIWEREKVTI